MAAIRRIALANNPESLGWRWRWWWGRFRAVRPPIPEVKREHARGLRVVDGDTIKVRLRSRTPVYVRLLGIDTPEA